MEKKIRNKALFCILFIDIVFSILILISSFVSNKTSNQTTIIILVLIIFSILASLLLYYFIYNFFKIEYEHEESVLYVNRNLSKDDYTEVICIKQYPHSCQFNNRKLYATIDTDDTVWIHYKDIRKRNIIYPVHPISKKEFTTYYKLKEE